MARKFRRLFFDIETSPNVGLFWRSGYGLTVPHENILKERAVICISWKWEHESAVKSLTWDAQHNDKAMLQRFVRVLDSADEAIAHNGNHFDLPWIRTRCLFHRIRCNWAYKTLDTKAEASRRLYLNSNALDYIDRFLGGPGKTKTDFQWWKDVMNDKPGALDRMVRYNKRDVRRLEFVFHRLQTDIAHKTHRAVHEGGEKWQCPTCASAEVIHSKHKVTAMGTVQHQMQCKKCHHYYTISHSAYEHWLEARIGLPQKKRGTP